MIPHVFLFLMLSPRLFRHFGKGRGSLYGHSHRSLLVHIPGAVLFCGCVTRSHSVFNVAAQTSGGLPLIQGNSVGFYSQRNTLRNIQEDQQIVIRKTIWPLQRINIYSSHNARSVVQRSTHQRFDLMQF